MLEWEIAYPVPGSIGLSYVECQEYFQNSHLHWLSFNYTAVGEEDAVREYLGISELVWRYRRVIRRSIPVAELPMKTSFAGSISEIASTETDGHSRLNSHSRWHNLQHCLWTRVRFRHTQRLPHYLYELQFSIFSTSLSNFKYAYAISIPSPLYLVLKMDT